MTTKRTRMPVDKPTAGILNTIDKIYQCMMCGNNYATQYDYFFKTQSALYRHNDKYSPICITCTTNLFERYKLKTEDELKALYRLCTKLDIYYSEKAYNTAIENKMPLLPAYIEIVNQFPYSGRCFDDSINDEHSEYEKNKAEINKLNTTIMELNSEIDMLKSGSNSSKVYSLEWMGEYTKDELDYLNNYYIGLNNDYKITTENHKDYARKISQASLYMNRCFQQLVNGKASNMDAYTKARDTFDTLCKSAKFSEQTRGINDVSLGGYGATAERVEKEEWIPRHIPVAQDDVDKLIDYFSTIQDSI